MRASFSVLLVILVSMCGCKPVNPTVEVTPIKVISESRGVGQPVKEGDLVVIDYRVVTEDGREILQHDGYRFIVGTASVIEGIDDAVRGMQVNGERVILCPPHRHWGRSGYGGKEEVPPNAMLTISIKLDAIE